MSQWTSLAQFAAMGGYGFYVWSAFGLTAVVMLAEVWSLRARHAALRQQVRPIDATMDDRTDPRGGAA